MVVTAERRSQEGQNVQRLHVDGTKKFATSTDPAFGHVKQMDLLIGMQTENGSYPFTGRIGEIIVYNGNLTEAERDQVEAYLKQKWVPKTKGVVQF